MSFLISLFLSLSWGFEPTTSAMQAFDKGLFHMLDSDANAEPELAEQYFTARLPNIIRTESETEFFRNTGLEPGILLKWAADYSQGRFKYINAVRLSFVLLHLDHSKKQIYIPKLLKNGLKENDANSLLCMALYEYRQPPQQPDTHTRHPSRKTATLGAAHPLAQAMASTPRCIKPISH